MASLSGLPTELVASVCEVLEGEYLLLQDGNYDDGVEFDLSTPMVASFAGRDLASFCQTCHRHRQIVEPLLYRRCGHSLDHVTAVMLLLRTLIERPSLAALVREIYIVISYRDEPAEIPFFDPAPFRETIRGLGFTIVEKRAVERLCNGIRKKPAAFAEAIASLYLAILPNLTKCHFRGILEEREPIARDLLSASKIIPGCKRLEILEISPISDSYGLWLGSQRSPSFLQLPSLQRLVLTGLYESSVAVWLSPGSLGISELSLMQPDVSEKMIKALLRACKRLECFEYIHEGPEHHRERVSPQQLITALQLHSSSLKRLVFTYSDSLHDWPLPQDYIYSSGLLTNLFTLEDLFIDEKYFSDFKLHKDIPVSKFALFTMLPPSIRSLWIVQMTGVIIAAIEYAASQAFESLPNLEIMGLEPIRRSTARDLEDLRQLFSSGKVKYQIQVPN